MNSNKNSNTKIIVAPNLIGENSHRNFLKLQATYGFAHRGGVSFPFPSQSHNQRLISDVNVLTSAENKHLVFSKSIFSN